MLKKITIYKFSFLIVFAVVNFSSITYSQQEYVLSDNPVYLFLERMEAQHFIDNYNSFEIPKTRKQISGYLKTLLNNYTELDRIDKGILDDLKVEFELELFGTLKNGQIDFFSKDYSLKSQKEKYLYFVNDTSSQVNMFINTNLGFENITLHSVQTNIDNSAQIYSFGGEFRGTLLNKFGFHYKGSFGGITGDKQAALQNNKLKNNFRFNDLSGKSFDRTDAAYITSDFNLVRLKFGRDRLKIGYGLVKSIFDENAPIFDYFGMKINYKAFDYSYLHGKILGESSSENGPIIGKQISVTDKYIGYHRLGINISDALNFGIGEMIVYGNRSLDFSYLNPFIIYKFVQNDNKDRDNSLLFFDFNSKIFKGVKFYGTFLIDDLDFSKIGTSYWGNQFLISVGVLSTVFYKTLPLDFQFEYMIVDPFVYTHRFSRNTYSNDGKSLASFVQPNSKLYVSKIYYRFTNRLKSSVKFTYMEHGANPLNTDGSVRLNVGGNLNLGHRVFDPNTVKLLSGDKEYTREVSFALNYEPINNYQAEIQFVYRNESLQRLVNNKIIETIFTLHFKL